MKSIHVLTPAEHAGTAWGATGVQLVDKAERRYCTGDWAIDPAKVQVGGRVYLHKAHDQESYFGGTVETVELAQGDYPRPRYKIYFRADEAGRGVKCRTWGSASAVAYQ